MKYEFIGIIPLPCGIITLPKVLDGYVGLKCLCNEMFWLKNRAYIKF